MRNVFVLLACGPASLAMGCACWNVTKQATPNPMTMSSRFFVDRLSFQVLRIGGMTETEFMGHMSPENREKWEVGKRAMTEGIEQQYKYLFKDTLSGTGIAVADSPEGAFTIKPHFFYYATMGRKQLVSTQIQAVIDIVDTGGNIVDEFQTQASATDRTESEGICARQLGWTTGKYVRARLSAPSLARRPPSTAITSVRARASLLNWRCRPPANTGESRTSCTGCSLSCSARTTAELALATPRRTSRSCATCP